MVPIAPKSFKCHLLSRVASVVSFELIQSGSGVGVADEGENPKAGNGSGTASRKDREQRVFAEKPAVAVREEEGPDKQCQHWDERPFL